MTFLHRAHLLAILSAICVAVATVRGQVSGDATISANDPVFGQITVSTSSQYAGAVSSIRWGGKEFINNWDHGRQLQPNSEFFNRYECYNPYEAGSKADGNKSTTSSRLLALTASGNQLESTTQMAWYMLTREPRESKYGDYCGDPKSFLACPPLAPGETLSKYQVHKTVRIGSPGIPNVIEYKSDLFIPEAVLKGLNQITAVVPYDFSVVRSYDFVSKSLRNVRLLGGGDDSIKVVATPDGRYALGFYSPEALQPYGNGNDTANWWYVVPPNPAFTDAKGQIDMEFACVHVGSVTQYESARPGDTTHDRAYLVLGNLEQVREGLSKVHFEFRALDPDVFNWRDYVALNHFESTLPDLASAENHWITQGLAQGLRGSKTFSAAQYLQINPDLGSYYGTGNYQGAIDHYISSGRSEGRGTTVEVSAGMQHMMVWANRDVTTSGENVFGQLGNGTTAGAGGTSQVDLSYVTEVAAGDYASLAVKSDGTLWMWGSNQYGGRGDGSSGDNIPTAVQVPMPVSLTTPLRSGKHAVAAGTGAFAAVDNSGQVWTWGVNWNGRLGDGSMMAHYTPARVRKSSKPDDYLAGVVSIAAAGGTMAAVDADGTVWTWGAGTSGALGNGSTQDSAYAVQVITNGPDNAGTPLSGISEVACGSSGFCIALTRYGGVFGWGNNDFAQLGVAPGGTLSIARWIPVAPTGAPVDAIAVGAAHCIARGTDGQVYGWGYNGRGQLGAGTVSVAQFPPSAMNSGPDGMGDISALGAGTNFSMMIRNSDGAVFVAGDNESGQLGTGAVALNQLLPARSSLSRSK